MYGPTQKILTQPLLHVLVLFLFPLTVWAAEPRIALVIGNGAYSADPLSDPPNDAQLIASTLRSLNFDVDQHVNLDEDDIKRVIREFEKRLKRQKDAVGLFYYSGHGMQISGRNYMIPVGVAIKGESDVEIDGVPIDEVLTRMRYAGNRMNFVILDACRDNPFEKSFKSPKKGLNKMTAPRGTLIAFATEPNTVARQGPGDYSIFTEALAEELPTPGISVEQMFKRVRQRVYSSTKEGQLPTTESKLLGDFYFTPKGVSPLPTPPRKEIARLLEEADKYFERKWYTTPKETNAYDLYKKVLNSDTDNRHARDKIEEIAQTYKDWGRTAERQSNLTKAVTYYERYLQIVPEDREIALLLKKLREREDGSARPGGREWVVDQTGTGDTRSIRDALRNARNGDRIIIKPGRYNEALRIHREVHVFASPSEQGQVIIECAGTRSAPLSFSLSARTYVPVLTGIPCLDISAQKGSIEGLTLRNAEVVIRSNSNGFLLKNNDISGKKDKFGYVVVVEGGRPKLEGNRIHNGKRGLLIKHGGGTYDKNEILDVELGIELSNRGTMAVFRNNRISAEGVDVMTYNTQDETLPWVRAKSRSEKQAACAKLTTARFIGNTLTSPRDTWVIKTPSNIEAIDNNPNPGRSELRPCV